ncbi:phage integrase family protein [Methylobacter tundripaludum]|uniref:Phage integrase family protein n=1 Tax=Methylobacter tundripaludum TaxID=173365 RepID=A0A2S6H5G8_9GAMM|nr:tyrosine-type recombinase/integrase [Methylobacter tundripaludum]PPK72697.1 phage integrase family protein [Methylobacter tundripaludum]
MASITKRKRSDGTIAYRADIRIKRKGVIVHQESRTFDRHALAKAWGAKRELELQEIEVYGEQKSVLIKDLISQYIERFVDNYGRSKQADIKRLTNYDIANIDAYKLKVSHLMNHCIERNKVAQPQTVQNDVIWLRVIMRTMRDVDGHDYSMDVFDDATIALKREKLIAKSNRRERRPTSLELWRLSRYFAKREGTIPMLRIMWFAIYSTRRANEACRLLWSDNNDQKATGMVRDLKHPKKKKGNNKRFKYTQSAWKIVQKQPKVDERIFPYNSKTICSYFADACEMLEIHDLHFHDLRHEGVSRLFESGLQIEQVQLVSLHQSWTELKRYTNLRPENLIA